MLKRTIIGKGAEGELYLTEFDGQKCVEKIRVSKAYRHPELDKRLRKRRTAREAKIIREARAAKISCPTLIFEKTNENSLIMEYIDGKLLTEVFEDADTSTQKATGLCKQAGEILGKLHLNKIVHGDYTTSNLMVDTNDKVKVIDFGLSEQTDGVEQRAIDLLLFERSLSDRKDYSVIFKEFLNQYSLINKRADEVMSRTKIILSRGRYRSRGQ